MQGMAAKLSGEKHFQNLWIILALGVREGEELPLHRAHCQGEEGMHPTAVCPQALFLHLQVGSHVTP